MTIDNIKKWLIQYYKLILFVLLGLCIAFFHYTYKSTFDKSIVDAFSKQFKRSKLIFKESFDFNLRLLNNTSFQLSRHRGKKIIILNFFATWCGPCKKEIPELNEFYNKYKGDDFIMIGIDVGEEKDNVMQFVLENKIAYPVGIAKEDAKFLEDYQIKAFPTTVFIGFDGMITKYETGAILNADVVFGNEIKRQKRNLIKRKSKQVDR